MFVETPNSHLLPNHDKSVILVELVENFRIRLTCLCTAVYHGGLKILKCNRDPHAVGSIQLTVFLSSLRP